MHSSCPFSPVQDETGCAHGLGEYMDWLQSTLSAITPGHRVLFFILVYGALIFSVSRDIRYHGRRIQLIIRRSWMHCSNSLYRFRRWLVMKNKKLADAAYV